MLNKICIIIIMNTKNIDYSTFYGSVYIFIETWNRRSARRRCKNPSLYNKRLFSQKSPI